MPSNEDPEGDIKPPVKKICKELTRTYIRELVKEATKRAIKEKDIADVQKVEEALRDLSDSEWEKIFQDSADEIFQNIYEGKITDDDLIKEISRIIEKDLDPHKISIYGRVGKKPYPRKSLPTKLLKIVPYGFVILALFYVVFCVVLHLPCPLVEPAALPILSVDKSRLYFEMDKNELMTDGSFNISNVGGGILKWSLASEPWIGLSQNTGSDFAKVRVHIQGSLDPGTHYGTITIRSNGGDTNIVVEATVLVDEDTPGARIPKVIYFEADPGRIGPDARSTLRWSVVDAEVVEIYPGIGPVGLEGYKSVSPEKSTTYTLTAFYGRRENKDEAEVTVLVAEGTPSARIPKIVYFEADPGRIGPDERSTLRWSVVDAEVVEIYPGIGPVGLEGYKSVSPEKSTIYTLTAFNGRRENKDEAKATVLVAEGTPGVFISDPKIVEHSIQQGIDLINQQNFIGAIQAFNRSL